MPGLNIRYRMLNGVRYDHIKTLHNVLGNNYFTFEMPKWTDCFTQLHVRSYSWVERVIANVEKGVL